MAGVGTAQAGEISYGSGGGSRPRLAPGALVRFVRAKPLGAISALILLVFVIVAVLAPLLAPYSAVANNHSLEMNGPSLKHLFGTDQYGRDVLSRIIFGARTSLYVGLGATLIGGFVAIAIGVLSAYAGGVLDYAIQRVVDTVQAIPALILLIGFLVILGPSLTNVIIALSLRSAFVTSRVMRGSAIQILRQPYVDSGRVIGCSHLRIMSVYILPNIMASVIVLASVNFGAAILAEASLSFLGYGVPPPMPSWGGMLSAEGRAYMFVGPWLLIAPTAVLTVVVFAANMFGDALRDILDPRLRQTGSGTFS
jgi:peptide/nickel transport system permease protein